MIIDHPDSCRWTEDEEGDWHTQCDEAFVFIEGGPVENRQRYCGYCGGTIIVVPYVEPKEEDEQL